MSDLSEHTVVVTGAGGHFGRAVCAALADEGAIVRAAYHGQLDVSKCSDVWDVLRQLKPYNALVHTAGIANGSLAELCRVNLIGTYNVLDYSIEYWKHNGISGRAVVLSGAGVGGPARSGRAAYAASKAGVVQLVESMMADLEGTGIRINALAPGSMPSKLNPGCTDDNTERAVACCLWLLGEQAAHVNGRLISAARDPWPFPPGEELGEDRYRLRRQA